MARRTKVALDEFRNNRWGNFMVRPSETPSEFWRAVKVLKRQRLPVPPIHGVRGVAFTTEDKAEAIARNPRATMQPSLRERGCEPDRAYPSTSTRSPHGRGRRRAYVTHVTGRGESHREVIPTQQGPGTGQHHLPRS
ncbi:hypothetical protein Trydic_g16200 [Trypoxylus dichotomus]